MTTLNKELQKYNNICLQETGLEVILTSGRTGKGLENLLIRAKQMSDEYDTSAENFHEE